MTITPPGLICFAGDVWDGNPHSRHHLMRRFADRGWNVLFVEGIAMRGVVGRDRSELRRIAAKLRAPIGSRTVAERLHVMRPFPIPPAGRLGSAVQLGTLAVQLRTAGRRHGLTGRNAAWFSVPVVAPLRGHLGERGSILYYQDRYEAFSHVNPPMLRRHLASLARGCEVSVATAVELAHDLRALGAAPTIVPHGVDIHRFASDDVSAPSLLEDLPRPLVGYVGLLDDYLAFDHLLAVADKMVDGTLVLVGPANVDVSDLERHPRIRLLGPQPYGDIPAYLQAFACCLVPFAINDLTVGVNPIKLREYLAAGRPVVSTLMPEVEKYADVVALADGPAHFAESVLAQLSPEADTVRARASRRARVGAESWDAVADRIEPLLRSLISS
jgi:glycosyltransferase involved in cell wall biosynthesis